MNNNTNPIEVPEDVNTDVNTETPIEINKETTIEINKETPIEINKEAIEETLEYIIQQIIQKPTKDPTEDPTEKPTEDPTEKPTESPIHVDSDESIADNVNDVNDAYSETLFKSQKMGFIISRHVRDVTTNYYWNFAVQSIRKHYPHLQIVIIDDNSDYNFVKQFTEYTNVKIINSEFNGRGELLPYIYLLKYRFFENALIMHDSVFIHKPINFNN